MQVAEQHFCRVLPWSAMTAAPHEPQVVEGKGALGGFVVDCSDGHEPKWRRYPSAHRGHDRQGQEIGMAICRACDTLIIMGITKRELDEALYDVAQMET